MPGVWQLAAGEQEPKLVIEGLEFSDWGNWRVADGTISYFQRRTRSVMSFDLGAKTNSTQRLIDGFVPTAEPWFRGGWYQPKLTAPCATWI